MSLGEVALGSILILGKLGHTMNGCEGGRSLALSLNFGAMVHPLVPFPEYPQHIRSIMYSLCVP